MPTSTEPALREAICRATRTLYERGHNAPLDGNVSARLGDGFLCTPSAVHKGQLAPSRVVRLAPDGSPVDRSNKPSSELAMHLAIYRARPDVGAIVHAHSPHAVALTVAGLDLERLPIPEAITAFGRIPTVPYASPTTTALADAALPYARELDAFILERHGPVCLGPTVDEALWRLEVLEHTARIVVLAHSLGGARPMPEDEVARLRPPPRAGS
jgi:L-fuculose-phosphate aldolase